MIHEIENYLDSISPSFIADVQELAKQYDVPSWGCGPTSYALAHIIARKFFQNEIPISSSYDNYQYEIVQRFSFADKTDPDTGVVSNVDYSWIEIYFKNKILFIDPTIGQFGKFNSIVYEIFDVGDQHIQDILHDKYGIEDVRLRKLVQKAIDRIPLEQEPYPYKRILPSSLEYYLTAADDANKVDAGGQPEEWKDWTDFLMKKYR